MILHITHNDLDGVGCGILVKKALGAGVHTLYSSTDELDDILAGDLDNYTSLIITDLAPTESRLAKLVSEKDITIIDHHKSSQSLKSYPFVTHAIGQCATLLTYHKFTAMGHDLSAYENFALCVNDFDIWLLQRNDSLRMNMLLSLYGLERFEARFLNEPYTSFKSEEDMLISFEEERRTAYIQNTFKNIVQYKDVNNQKFATVFAEMYSSELGNYILQNADVDYVMLINAQRRRVSLRSRADVDISTIAMRNGGGGHKNAAGFALDTDFSVPEVLKKAGIIA